MGFWGFGVLGFSLGRDVFCAHVLRLVILVIPVMKDLKDLTALVLLLIEVLKRIA